MGSPLRENCTAGFAWGFGRKGEILRPNSTSHNISHAWLLQNTCMDRVMLKKWLAAGYLDKGTLFQTEQGTPQGGIISPTLLTVTLSGLEQAVKASTHRKDKVNVCVYADDFIITGSTWEVLANKVYPIVKAFLSERGLTLSPEKTKITHISEGFEFLGMNIRKYNKGKLIIKPAKSSVIRFLTDIQENIKCHPTSKTENLIRLLNPKIRGWVNYYQHVCSKETFTMVDHKIFKATWKWAVRRHPKKGLRWIKDKYYRNHIHRKWVFSATVKDKKGGRSPIDLIEAAKTPIIRHIKIKADATPYDPAYQAYFNKRTSNRRNRMGRGIAIETNLTS